MELAGLAVGPYAAIVVNAVGDVGGFLNLEHEVAPANAVHASGWQIEHIAGLHHKFIERTDERMVGNLAAEILRLHLAAESGIEVGPVGGRDAIPHFVLSQRIMAPHGEGVVGMDLDGKVVVRVDKLYEQGEFSAGRFIDVRAEDFGSEFIHELAERLALERAVAHHRLVAGHGRHLPAFAYVVVVAFNALEGGDSRASPYYRLQYILEFYNFLHHSFLR